MGLRTNINRWFLNAQVAFKLRDASTGKAFSADELATDEDSPVKKAIDATGGGGTPEEVTEFVLVDGASVSYTVSATAGENVNLYAQVTTGGFTLTLSLPSPANSRTGQIVAVVNSTAYNLNLNVDGGGGTIFITGGGTGAKTQAAGAFSPTTLKCLDAAAGTWMVIAT